MLNLFFDNKSPSNEEVKLEESGCDREKGERLRKSNPQAFANTLKRMIEAAGRGLWDADSEMLAKLQDMYREMDDQLEGVVVTK